MHPLRIAAVVASIAATGSLTTARAQLVVHEAHYQGTGKLFYYCDGESGQAWTPFSAESRSIQSVTIDTDEIPAPSMNGRPWCNGEPIDQYHRVMNLVVISDVSASSLVGDLRTSIGPDIYDWQWTGPAECQARVTFGLLRSSLVRLRLDGGRGSGLGYPRGGVRLRATGGAPIAASEPDTSPASLNCENRPSVLWHPTRQAPPVDTTRVLTAGSYIIEADAAVGGTEAEFACFGCCASLCDGLTLHPWFTCLVPSTRVAYSIEVLAECPAIITEPTPSVAQISGGASFSIAVTGTSPSFQWRRNGGILVDDARISGATSTQLVIQGIQPSDQASYDCVVTSPCGTITSAPAPLSCKAAITTQPEGGSFIGGQQVTLSVVASNASGASYRWRKNGVNLFNGITYQGVPTPTLVINADEPSQSGTYSVAITNACGVTVSQAADVEVTCPADFNVDGGVDGQDMFEFFDAWSNGLSSADLNFDGGTDGSDVNAFYGRWENGC